MRKEALFAILIGIIAGLGITYGIYRIRQIITPSPIVNTETTENTFMQQEDEVINEKLFITVPEDGSITSKQTQTISGTAEPNEFIVILISDDQFITQADDIGAFAQEVPLKEGGNVIQIFALTTEGKQKKKQLVVARETETAETNIESTESATVKEDK